MPSYDHPDDLPNVHQRPTREQQEAEEARLRRLHGHGSAPCLEYRTPNLDARTAVLTGNPFAGDHLYDAETLRLQEREQRRQEAAERAATDRIRAGLVERTEAQVAAMAREAALQVLGDATLPGVRLSEAAADHLRTIADHYGLVRQVDVLELALREVARACRAATYDQHPAGHTGRSGWR